MANQRREEEKNKNITKKLVHPYIGWTNKILT